MSKKSIVAWCLYDWANSAFALTIMAGFFPVFFKQYWSIGVDPAVSTAHLGLANSTAGFIVAFSAPLLGAFADCGRSKKKFLAVFALAGTLCCVMLGFVPPAGWFMALLCYGAASVCFISANMFYDALLPDIASAGQLDLVSSYGFAAGYIGSSLLFVFNCAMVLFPAKFGLSSAAAAIPFVFCSVGIWWAIFSFPLFIFVRQTPVGIRQSLAVRLRCSISELRNTIGKIRGQKHLMLFLLAYWLYIDGINTFIQMSTDFGLVIGLSSKTLLSALLLVQLVAAPASIGLGLLARKTGTAPAIGIGLCIYIIVCTAGALLLRTGLHYILLAAAVGMAQGGVQALSRSYFAKIIPPESAAEYFGFYNFVGKWAVIIGPSLIGAIALISRSAGCSSSLSSRLGMSSTAILFIGGAILLFFADKARKRAL